MGAGAVAMYRQSQRDPYQWPPTGQGLGLRNAAVHNLLNTEQRRPQASVQLSDYQPWGQTPFHQNPAQAISQIANRPRSPSRLPFVPEGGAAPALRPPPSRGFSMGRFGK